MPTNSKIPNTKNNLTSFFSHMSQEEYKFSRGFTLLELMVAIAIFGIVIGGIYNAYRSQLRVYVTQQQVMDMQQNLRASMAVMIRKIRMAGLNSVGFIDGFPDTGNKNTFTTKGSSFIAFSFNNERIAYRLNGSDLDRYFVDASDPSTGEWHTIAENIDAFNVVLLNSIKEFPPGTPVASTIDTVEISIVARAGENTAVLSNRVTDEKVYENQQKETILDKSGSPDNFRRQMLSASVTCRNNLF